jgi:hypothetical protein
MSLLVAGVFAALAAINLWGEIHYSLQGIPTLGKVIEFHYTRARSNSIVAQVEVVIPGAPPFRWEVDDAFGTQNWEPEGTVPLLCTHIHADHLSCVLDSWLDRFLFPSIMLSISAGLVWWTLKRSGAGVQ